MYAIEVKSHRSLQENIRQSLKLRNSIMINLQNALLK